MTDPTASGSSASASATPSASPRSSTRRARLTLVTGASGAAREAAIARHLAAYPLSTGASCAALLEGLPAGQPVLLPSDTLDVERIAPSCLCCTGNLVLRVVLNRILRRRPDCLYIGVATTDHLDQLRSWLQQQPYDQLLELTPDLAACSNFSSRGSALENGPDSPIS